MKTTSHQLLVWSTDPFSLLAFSFHSCWESEFTLALIGLHNSGCSIWHLKLTFSSLLYMRSPLLATAQNSGHASLSHVLIWFHCFLNFLSYDPSLLLATISLEVETHSAGPGDEGMGRSGIHILLTCHCYLHSPWSPSVPVICWPHLGHFTFSECLSIQFIIFFIPKSHSHPVYLTPKLYSSLTLHVNGLYLFSTQASTSWLHLTHHKLLPIKP